MRNKIVCFNLIFALFLLYSCTEKSSIIKFIFLDGIELQVKDFNIYENSEGGIYVYIKNQSERNKVFKSPIAEVDIVKENIPTKGKKVDIFYSREVELKPFIFYVDNKKQTIISDDLNGFEVFFIGFRNDLSEIIDSNLISIQPIKYVQDSN